MDIDRGLIAAVLREGYPALSKVGLTLPMIEGEGRPAFEFLEKYWREHAKLPDAEVIRDQVGVVTTGTPKEPVAFWSAEIKKRYLYNALQVTLAKILDPMEKANSHEALVEYRKGFFELETLFKESAGVESVFSDIETIMDEHDRAKLGIIGIPSPYPTLNEATQGWQPEEMIVIAGRPGLGKTNLMIIMAVHAWLHGHKILFISTEMSRQAIRRRFAAFVCKIPYGKLRRGKLTGLEEDALRKKLKEIENDPRLLMLGSDMRPTLEAVEAQCLVHKPDMLCIDGYYLMKSEAVNNAKNKADRISENLDLTKGMLKRLKIPGMLTTQMNRPPQNQRSTSGGGKPDLDRLAFSDNMGMIADYVFFLERGEKLRQEKLIKMIPVKMREADFVDDLYLNWDFDNHNFTESDKKDIEEEEKKKKSASKSKPKAFKDDDDDDEPAVPW